MVRSSLKIILVALSAALCAPASAVGRLALQEAALEPVGGPWSAKAIGVFENAGSVSLGVRYDAPLGPCVKIKQASLGADGAYQAQFGKIQAHARPSGHGWALSAQGAIFAPGKNIGPEAPKDGEIRPNWALPECSLAHRLAR